MNLPPPKKVPSAPVKFEKVLKAPAPMIVEPPTDGPYLVVNQLKPTILNKNIGALKFRVKEPRCI